MERIDEAGAPPHRDESAAERRDRQLDELLQELRVVLPGVQVLLAFLLTVPFSRRFSETTGLQRDVYFAALLLTAAATVLLMAPSAIHRLLFQRGAKGRVVEIGHRLTMAGLVMMVLAIACAVFVVTDLLFGTTSAIVAAGLILVLAAVVWVVLPLAVRPRDAG